MCLEDITMLAVWSLNMLVIYINLSVIIIYRNECNYNKYYTVQ
jgi:hypothetical protein